MIGQAHAGVHETGVRRSRIDRLIVATLTLTYDLLTLVDPPIHLPTQPHDAHVRDMAREMRGDEE